MNAPTTIEYTPEDLLAMPDGNRYELVDGRLVDRHGANPARQEHPAIPWLSDLVATRLAARLTVFCDTHGLGLVVISNSGGFQYSGRKVRKPDVAFVSCGRMPPGGPPIGNATVAPDLAVEVLSPNDLAEEVEEKVEEYLRSGVRLVWVISPVARTVRVLRANGSTAMIREGGELDGEDVVPGFRCRVADLFPTEVVPPDSPANGDGNA